MKTLPFRKNILQGAVLLASMLAAQNASAILVAPGGISALGGTTVALSPDLAGVVIRDQLIPFQVTNGLGQVLVQGNVQDRVVQSNNTGELIFAPRLRDLSSPNGTAWISGFQMTGFDGFITDIDYRTDGLGDVGPDAVSRGVSGDPLTYRFDPSLLIPPDESFFLSVDTDALNYDLSGMFTIYAQNDFGAGAFFTELREVSAPSAVPVPAAVWLFGSGLAGLIGVMRRREQDAE